MEEQLISLETAMLAKEKGFNIKTYYSWVQPVVTKRGTSIKEERDYQIEKTDSYNSFTEITYPNEDYYAPTQSFLQKWLRERHEIQMSLEPFLNVFECNIAQVEIINDHEVRISKTINSGKCKTYEEALEKGLEAGLNLI